MLYDKSGIDFHLFLFPILGILLFGMPLPLAKIKRALLLLHNLYIPLVHYIKSFYFSLFSYYTKTINNRNLCQSFFPIFENFAKEHVVIEKAADHIVFIFLFIFENRSLIFLFLRL